MISLKHYIKRRNGVALGHPKSLNNMIIRAFGAKSFDLFWVHWNPIWSFYLSKYIYKPLKRVTHTSFAVVLTFCCSGFIHDLVGFFIYKRITFIITLWFLLMGMLVIFFKTNNFVYKTQNKLLHFFFTILLILCCFVIAKYIRDTLFYNHLIFI